MRPMAPAKTESRASVRKLVLKLAKADLRLAMEEHANNAAEQDLLEEVTSMKSKLVFLEAHNQELLKVKLAASE